MSATNDEIDDRTRRGSPDRFGYSWGEYPRVLPEHRIQLERWLGSTGLASFRGKRALDVGCGMGRNPYWMLDAGAESVVAIDMDDRSLDAARQNLSKFPNARVEKHSAYELRPDLWGSFDRVTCIGVLHHLDAPEVALERMWSCVAPGGDLVLWCYGKEGNRLLLPIIRGMQQLGSRLPLPVTHAVARATTALIWPALHVIPFRTEYYKNLKTLSFRNVENIVFDQMLPKIAHYWTREDMQRLVAPLGGAAHIEMVQDNSWHVRVTKSPS